MNTTIAGSSAFSHISETPIPIPDMNITIRVLTGKVLIQSVTGQADPGEVYLSIDGVLYKQDIKEEVIISLVDRVMKGPGFETIHSFEALNGIHHISVLASKGSFGQERALKVDEL